MNSKIFIFLSLLILVSCSDDSSDDFTQDNAYGNNNNNDNNDNNDTVVTETYTYTDHIQSIMTTNCVLCHSNPPKNGASSSLTTYEDVKNSVKNMGLIDRITRNEGDVGFMPKNGTKLPQNLIDQIIQWKNDGFPE